MDEANTMIGKTHHVSASEFESLRNNFFINTIFLTKKDVNHTHGPLRIQYIFCSIVPLCVSAGDFVYPNLVEFKEFNKNNTRSFGEFSSNHMAKLIHGLYDTDVNNPSNASKLVQELMKNKHDIRPFLELGLPWEEVCFLNKNGRNYIKMQSNFWDRD
eukprot:GAHX01003788.1.p1 GENE.GAHX01003788.1~~GAHX01003788.1.p1  ORF type:complete len:158 (-),score=16.21 GAHX01003788.1:93-566(-)